MERVPISGIARLSTWESWEKRHLGVAHVVNYKKYYKGEGGGFPQVWAMVSLIRMLVPCLCTKNVPTMH